MQPDPGGTEDRPHAAAIRVRVAELLGVTANCVG